MNIISGGHYNYQQHANNSMKNIDNNHKQPQQLNKSMTQAPNIPLDVIDDLCSRFIINIPPEERSDLIRVCFHIELAHWFYIDYYCAEQKELPKCQFKEFTRLVLQNVPFLQQHVLTVYNVIDKFRDYKMAVPTYGAILLDQQLDNVLLVQGFWAKSSWGFPKGKVNADEDPVVCACREVLEETGYDCSAKVSAKDYIELHIQDTLIRLYIVTGVDKDTIFKPMTRCEIKNCNWFRISDLPMSRKDVVTIQNKALKSSAFYMTIPFIKPLKKWIYRKRKSLSTTTNEETSGDDVACDEPSVGQDETEIVLSALFERARVKSAIEVNNVTNNINNNDNKDVNNSSSGGSSSRRRRVKNLKTLNTSKNNNIEINNINKRQKFWSNTWESVKIDWNEIMRDLDKNNNDNNNIINYG